MTFFLKWEDKQKVPEANDWEDGSNDASKMRTGVIWIMNDYERFVVCPLLLNVRDDASESCCPGQRVHWKSLAQATEGFG